MKEYNWRKEREKYRAVSNEDMQRTEEVSQPAAAPAKKMQWKGILSTALTVATLIAIAAWVIVHYYGDSSVRLSSVAEKHKEAVGLITMTFEFEHGQKVTVPLGTAWAFSPNQFATNAHVISAIQDIYRSQISSAVNKLLSMQALEAKCSSVKDYLSKKSKEQADDIVNKAKASILNGIKDVKIRININNSNRKSYDVTHFAVHKEYGDSDTKFNPDVAVLTIPDQHSTFFKIATKKQLYSLKSGKPIAFLGFPMENLSNNNVNINNPVASMQSGIIVAISDFELVNKGEKENVLIRHNLPATGGASGSPIFTTSGEVIALLYGGNMIRTQKAAGSSRTPSAAQINFAVRVDLLTGIGSSSDIKDLFK